MIERFGDWRALVEAAADRLGEALEVGLGRRGAATLACAGGSTPGDIYRRLSGRPLDWAQVTVTLTDERWVEAGSPDSNARLVRETLLQGAASEARLLPLKDEASTTPESAAALAERALSAAPPFAAVLLGMGADGHFASLFPDSPALAAGLDPRGRARVVAVPAGEPAPSQPRLSLTLSALLEAPRVLLAIRGPEKLAVLERAAGDRLPAGALLEQDRAPVSVMWAP